MLDAITRLHDATLLSVRFDWIQRRCELAFRGAPSIAYPFTLTFDAVTELTMTARDDWGPSESVLVTEVHPDGRHVLSMQSGDQIVLVAAGYSFRTTRAVDTELPEPAESR